MLQSLIDLSLNGAFYLQIDRFEDNNRLGFYYPLNRKLPLFLSLNDFILELNFLHLQQIPLYLAKYFQTPRIIFQLFSLQLGLVLLLG